MFGFKCFYLFVYAMRGDDDAPQTSGGAADNKGPRWNLLNFAVQRSSHYGQAQNADVAVWAIDELNKM